MQVRGSSSGKKLTPVMRQYEEAKAAHPDAILFFRMGDFYEMFREDAVIAARLLDIALTSRNKGNPDEEPMAGVPHHAAAGYVARLLAFGHKVAICEQMADPSTVKGIVPRQVVRVITPGLVTDTEQLDARANHYLVAVDTESGNAERGIALLDLSTGELSAGIIPDLASLLAELARCDPREVLVGGGLDPDVKKGAGLAAPRAVLRDDEPLEDGDVAATIDGSVAEPIAAEAASTLPIAARRAAARALRFAHKCTPGSPLPVRRIAPYDPTGAMRIDETAQVHLELVRGADGSRKGTLLETVDATVTPAGARLLRRRLLAPLLDVAAIRRRLDEVQAFVENPRARGELREALGRVGDLERLSVRAVLREATPKDLGALRDGLLAAPAAVAATRSIVDTDGEARELFGAEVDTLPEIAAKLAAALVDRPPALAREGGFVREEYDAELATQRRLARGGAEEMTKLEAELREKTGAGSLRIRYTRVFGWYIEVTKTHLGKVPPDFRRKQTVAGGERFTSDRLDELADGLENAESRALARETDIFEGLVRLVAENAERIRRLARTLASWDVAAALADVAHRQDYVRPVVDMGEALVIESGRHPVVERLAAAGRFVPNDTMLDLGGERLWLLTGPNMAGKSTLMRQVALITILAQAGSFVPAQAARIGLVDRVLSRVGASDNVARGESTFMVEMRETATILRDATRRSLVILDEIGRGTSTYDGLAIAWAVAEHLYDAVGCRAMFATHYHELTELAQHGSGVANWSVSAREHGGDVVFLHKLVKGPASRSYGVAVARLAGLPEPVLARAKAILSTLEAGAPLPSGKHATMRGRTRQGGVQLDLFAKAKPDTDAAAPVLETLRAVEIERLTPLDALTFVARLKSLLPS
ncbi:DNA mismatch repair protein MutS [Polyangium sp. y55x31]|uniref:DNA mismatch repair protein MutS n=1 Tax=Polyangium sp. y55x31 TaxID=3042688 RepID=UPI00248323C3|nr:DNA mismatch repair protein MutS [Polyangium sp. y55x31]MDI1475681.1 DNA mismatch repair protein MutS [Polyangium sp. y55x31]